MSVLGDMMKRWEQDMVAAGGSVVDGPVSVKYAMSDEIWDVVRLWVEQRFGRLQLGQLPQWTSESGDFRVRAPTLEVGEGIDLVYIAEPAQFLDRLQQQDTAQAYAEQMRKALRDAAQRLQWAASATRMEWSAQARATAADMRQVEQRVKDALWKCERRCGWAHAHCAQQGVSRPYLQCSLCSRLSGLKRRQDK